MKKKLIIGAVAVLAVMLALAGLVFFVRDVGGKNDEIKELEAKLEEMERKQIATDAIKEEIKQISKYSAYEFDYTSILCFSDQSKLLGIKIPLTGSQFIATLDGKMNIGIDGEKIQFTETKDSEGRVTQVTLMVPRSEVLDNYTITDSLKIYDERSNIFNPVKVEDYNNLRAEAEQKEAEKVQGSDILQKSDESVKYLLMSHFQAVYGDGVEIRYEYLEEKE